MSNDLYVKAKNNEQFPELMPYIFSFENIQKALDDIHQKEKGKDKDLQKMSLEDIIEKMKYLFLQNRHGYHPLLLKKQTVCGLDGYEYPFCIPNIWDRLIEQCIKQVLDPQCIDLQWKITKVLTNRSHCNKGKQLSKTGNILSKKEDSFYKRSKMMRYWHGYPIYPIGYIRYRYPSMTIRNHYI